MKVQKTMVGFLGALAVLLCGANNASAAWCETGVIVEAAVLTDMASATASKYGIKLNCDDASWDAAETSCGGACQFILSIDMGDSGYATALTAMSLGQKVSMNTESRVWNSLATRIKLLPTAAP